MSSRTPTLGLILTYLQDQADQRVDNENWLKLDRLFNALEGHDHDGGEGGPLVNEINYFKIFQRINDLEERIRSLEFRLTKLEIFVNQFYEEFLVHNHDGVSTIWSETFSNYEQTDLGLSTGVITPAIGYLHLPLDYVNNQTYRWAGKPFLLNRDPDPDPDMPTRATGRIFLGAERGNITPYLAIANSPTWNTTTKRYNGSVAGTFLGEAQGIEEVLSQYSFIGKIRGQEDPIPHAAYYTYAQGFLSKPRLRRTHDKSHHHGGGGGGGGGKHHHHKKNRHRGPRSGHDKHHPHYHYDWYWLYTEKPRWAEFSQSDYDRIAVATGEAIEGAGTVDDDIDGGGINPTEEETQVEVTARPLYHGDVVLCWERENNTFYWFDALNSQYTEITKESLGPIYNENMIEVAAGIDEDSGEIYVLKSWVEEEDNPPGHFHVRHQIIRWNQNYVSTEANSPPEFTRGNIWSAGRLRRYFWYPRLICPTHLEITAKKIHIITHLNWFRIIEHGGLVNYYHDHGDWQWFPFMHVFGDLHKSMKYCSFTHFNPGLLGTIHTCSKVGNWVPTGPAKFINGVFPPQKNKFSVLSEEECEVYEGANDKVYLGREGDYLIFYQAFVPHNGEEILAGKHWDDDNWIEANPDLSWHGLVKYNLTTGKVEYVRGDTPCKVNTSGVVDNGKAVLCDGIELVKQWIIKDIATGKKSLMATPNNVKPVQSGKKVIGSFWVKRAATEAQIADRVSIRDELLNPISIGIVDGAWERIATAGSRIAVSVATSDSAHICHPHRVRHSRGHCRIGGWIIIGRKSLRCRPRDHRHRRCRKWIRGILDGGRPRHLFKFYVNDLQFGDELNIHYNGKAVGGRVPLYQSSEAVEPQDQNERDVNVYVWSTLNWKHLPPANRPFRGPWRWKCRGHLDLEPGTRVVWVMVEAQRESDARRNSVCKIITEYIYLTHTRQGVVRSYEWEDLPQGEKAALSLDLVQPSGEELTFPFKRTALGGPGQMGIMVDNVRLNINSSY
jgi:hypothetical protein